MELKTINTNELKYIISKIEFDEKDTFQNGMKTALTVLLPALLDYMPSSAEWLERDVLTSPEYKSYKCSRCGYVVSMSGVDTINDKYHTCPNCWAIMSKGDSK